jgi:hypothetical protein
MGNLTRVGRARRWHPGALRRAKASEDTVGIR